MIVKSEYFADKILDAIGIDLGRFNCVRSFDLRITCPANDVATIEISGTAYVTTELVESIADFSKVYEVKEKVNQSEVSD